jgi:hypothetical protein
MFDQVATTAVLDPRSAVPGRGSVGSGPQAAGIGPGSAAIGRVVRRDLADEITH